ncbi:hypothetical protein FRB90_011963 [Tulasnella sp. 427]|nr:hypothetical protein FRB90_011963 [Tulasnella sp. 427]
MSLDITSFILPSHAAIAAATLVAILLLNQRGGSKRSGHPPGPSPLPLIGNVLDLPQSKYALTYSRFGEEYGPLTWLNIPGQNLLILNSMEAVTELLEKRALNFIDRPNFTMLNKLLGMDGYLTFTNYNSTWKTQRALLKQPLSASVVKTDYCSLLESKAKQYLVRCLSRPEDFLTEINQVVAETVIKLTYGRLEDERGVDYVKINTHLTDILVWGMEGFAVDLVPALQYLPSWLPGMQFKVNSARWRKEMRELERNVLESVKASLRSDDPEVRSSFMFKKFEALYDGNDETKDADQLAKDEMELMRAGLTIFFDVQRNARLEIDRVVGKERLPNFRDQADLPYLHAVVLETLRQDDTYGGYFIPKGTTVIGNAWGFSRNPQYYTNPWEFDPTRHLKQPPELDPRQYAFGYGRRICPGKELAFQQTWMMAASIIWAFDLVATEANWTSQQDQIDHFTFGLLK